MVRRPCPGRRLSQTRISSARSGSQPAIPPTTTSGSGKPGYRSRHMLTVFGSTLNIAAMSATLSITLTTCTPLASS